MNFLKKLFIKNEPIEKESNAQPITSGAMIAELTSGSNLVGAKQTWEDSEEKKHDLEHMKKCCNAELKTMEKSGLVPAPYYFERVAILSRKEKNYRQEIEYCELYINTVENFYKKHGIKNKADVRKGPRFLAIVKRLPKAKELLSKTNNGT